MKKFLAWLVISGLITNMGDKLGWPSGLCGFFVLAIAVIVYNYDSSNNIFETKEEKERKERAAIELRAQAIREQKWRELQYEAKMAEKRKAEEEKRKEEQRRQQIAKNNYIDCEIKNLEKCKQAFIALNGVKTKEAYVTAADLISKNFKRDTIKWTDKVLDELGSIWNKTKFEVRNFDEENDYYNFHCHTKNGSSYDILCHGWANPLYETAILNGDLYVRVSEKVKRIVLANDCYKERLYELHPEIKNTRLSKTLHTKTERSKMTKDLRDIILNRDNYTCQCCGRKGGNGVLMEVDHIIPVSKGGMTVVDNLQTLCWECNRTKGSKVTARRLFY